MEWTIEGACGAVGRVCRLPAEGLAGGGLELTTGTAAVQLLFGRAH